MSRRRFIIITAVITAVLIAIPFACNEKLTETFYTVKTDKVTSEVKLAFISDLHNTAYGQDMSELIESVHRFAPDFVIFGGDLFDSEWGEEKSVIFVKELVKKYPCLYSIGNHEMQKDAELIKAEMRKLGVTVLDGQYTDIAGIRVHGIDGGSSAEQLKACEAALSPDRFSLLINHYPEEFPKLSGYGFDLILSGHAHGGQLRLPPFINGVYAPGEGLFPKFAGGEYFSDGSEMIVSRGLQRCPRDLIIPRIFNRPEAVYITISPE